MPLLVLRSLAVYGGTAGLALYLTHRFVQPIRLRVAVTLACAPLLFTGPAILTDGVYAPIDIAYLTDPLASHRTEARVFGVRTSLLSDVVWTYIPGVKAVREAVKNGRLPLWNRFNAAGEPLLAFQQPAVFHPGTWVGFLLPLAEAWTFDIALRLLIAVVSAYLFFRDVRCGKLPSFLGAAGWAFCDHMVFYLGYSVGAAVSAFPLLLLGLRRLVRDTDRRAVGLTVVSLTLIAVAGHPETLLHCVAGGGVYFLFELAFAERKGRLRPLRLALTAGALALGLTAVALLPLREILPTTQQGVMRSEWWSNQSKSVSLELSAHRSLRNLLPFGIGLSKGTHGEAPLELPAAYCGSLLYPLAFVGLFSKRREKWAFLFMMALGLAFWARLAGITDLVSKLPLFDIAINDYLVFLAAFGIVALSTLGAELVLDGQRIMTFALAAAASAAILSLSLALLRPHFVALVQLPHPERRSMVLQIAPLILAAAVLLSARRGSKALRAGALLILFLAQRRMEAGPIYRSFRRGAFYPALDVLRMIPRGAAERVTALGHLFIPNVSAMYELEDVRGYEAMTLEVLYDTNPLWCVAQPIWYNRVDDLTRPFLSFLNVRYALAPMSAPLPPYWRVVGEGSGVRVLENPRALPRVFTPRSVRFESRKERQIEMLQAIEDFGSQGVVGADGPDGWVENGDADVQIASYSGQDLSLRIDAKSETILAASIPRWPGWKLTVDGQRTSLLPYNRAFLAFRVSPGRHVARLVYLPDGFLTGAAISAVTLVVVGLLLARRRVPRSGGPVSPP